MKKINTPTSVNGAFVDGNPAVGRKATQFNAEWCNNVQMELWNAIKKVSGSDPAGAQTMDDFATALDTWLGKVLVDSSDSTPGKLAGKFYDVGSPIGVSAVNVGTGRYIVIGIKEGSVDTVHLKDDSCATAKIPDGAVTTHKIPDGNITGPKLENQSVSGLKIGYSVVDSQYDNVNVYTTDIVDQPTSRCDVLVHTFNPVNYGGFIDFTMFIDGGFSENMSEIKFQIRKSGESNVDCEWNVGNSTYFRVSRRMVVKNSSLYSAQYELHLVCVGDFNPGGVPISGFLACDVDIRGIIVA